MGPIGQYLGIIFAPFELVLNILRYIEERQPKNTSPVIHGVGNLFVPDEMRIILEAREYARGEKRPPEGLFCAR